jgi:hypothetical protein
MSFVYQTLPQTSSVEVFHGDASSQRFSGLVYTAERLDTVDVVLEARMDTVDHQLIP